eukprot:5557160-Lingulodinium_polyedra.AAC.1
MHSRRTRARAAMRRAAMRRNHAPQQHRAAMHRSSHAPQLCSHATQQPCTAAAMHRATMHRSSHAPQRKCTRAIMGARLHKHGRITRMA